MKVSRGCCAISMLALAVLGLAGLAIAMEAPPCENTCAGSVQLASISPPQCEQPSLCAYRCAMTYLVYQTEATINVLSLLPTTADCGCASGAGQLSPSSAGITLQFSDGTSAVASVSSGSIVIQAGGCTSVYKVTSGSVLNISGPPATAAGTVALSAVSPPECEQESSCFYQCAMYYTAQQSGSTVLVTSLAGYISSCFCAVGTGTVQGGTASVQFSDGSTAVASPSGSSVLISSTVQGLQCNGVYSVVAGSVLGVPATSELLWGTLKLSSVSPLVCNASTDCAFLCSLQYQVVQAASNLVVLPTSGAASSCSCDQGQGTVTGAGSASVSFPSGVTAKAAASGSTVTITTTVEGQACSAVYAVASGMVLGVPASGQLRRV
jgi:hypothetical protein